MAFSKINEHYSELKKDALSYLRFKAAYVQLLVLKKTTKFISRIIKILLGIFILCFFLFFVSIGAAILIGEYLDNVSYGFFIVAGFYLFVFILLLLFGKYFFRTQVLKSLSLKMVKIPKIKI